MAELTVQPFTRAEAEEATDKFIGTGVQLRHMLLELFERKAHTALGFGDDFEQYASDRLGVEWKAAYLRQLRLWARIEREVCPVISGKSALTQNVAMELSRLPDEERVAALAEARELVGSGINPLRDLKHIVNRRLNVPDNYGRAKQKEASVPPAEPAVDPDIPVGSLVDVRTGRVVQPEPETPAAPAPPSVPSEPVQKPKPPVSTFTPAPDPEPPEDPFVNESAETERIENSYLTYLSDVATAQLQQFRRYYGLDCDIETVEKVLAALYVIYNHKPAFQRHAAE